MDLAKEEKERFAINFRRFGKLGIANYLLYKYLLNDKKEE